MKFKDIYNICKRHSFLISILISFFFFILSIFFKVKILETITMFFLMINVLSYPVLLLIAVSSLLLYSNSFVDSYLYFTIYELIVYYISDKYVRRSIKSNSSFIKTIDIITISLIVLFSIMGFVFFILNSNYTILMLTFIVLLCLFKTYYKYIFDSTLVTLLRNRIYIKRADSIIDMLRVKNVFFDKTGVVTLGRLRISRVNTEDKEKLFYYLNYGEYYSNHPIASVIKEYRTINVDKNKIKDYKEMDGKGVSLKLNKESVLIGNYYLMKMNNIEVDKLRNVGTIIYVSVNNEIIGSIVISDSIKKATKNTFTNLRDLGIKNIIVLSGDNERHVGAVCNEFKIDDYYSNLNRDEKMFWYKYLNDKYNTKSIYVSNYLYSNANIDTDFNFSINNKGLDFNKYDIISTDNDIKIVVDFIKIVKDFKKSFILGIVILLLMMLINILLDNYI